MALKLSHPLIRELCASLSTFAITLCKILMPDVCSVHALHVKLLSVAICLLEACSDCTPD